MSASPQRIVCLTEESVEILYLLGCEEKIVGVSGFAVRPPGVREKQRISTFTDAKYEEIDALRPDLVFAFSDMQADLVRELIRRGHNVFTFNQRTIAGILNVIQTIANIMELPVEGRRLCDGYVRQIESLQAGRPQQPPRVYFEEWFDPMISGIRWVSELIAIAGGRDIFEEKSVEPGAKGRIVTPEMVIAADPEIIIGSWCGKMFKPDHIRSRPGWERITAVREGRLFDIPSSMILQPGPACLTDGLDALVRIIRQRSA